MREVTRLGFAAAIAVLLLAGSAPGAQAAADRSRTYQRPFGMLAKASPQLLGPGGATKLRGTVIQSLLARSFMSPPVLSGVVTCNVEGCGVPTVTTSGDSFTVTWPSACVFPGDGIVLKLHTTGSAITTVHAFYADASGDSIAPAIDSEAVPGAGPGVVGALTALLAFAGAFALRTRRRAAATA
jgi:MYXO-CTERM domain-containing protein